MAEDGVRLVARRKDGHEGSVILPVHLAEELGEGLIRLVRKFERKQAAKMKWDVI